MPGAANNTLDADTVAKMIARFETSNPSEAEAINAMRMFRRMVAAEGLRVVDVLERADVKQALDAQLQPVREDSAELKEAFGKVRQLGDELAQERDITAELRQELVSAQPRGRQACSLPPAAVDGLVNGVLVAVTALVVVALLIAAAMH
jgi:hypothetical protein